VVAGAATGLMSAPGLTAVVLTYNGRHLLEVLLPSLAAQSYRDFSIVVVDNGSSDDTLAWLGASWPEVDVVALPANIGVTAALNAGLRAVSSDFVCLLNNDMDLHPECLGELVGALREHTTAGSASPKLLSHHDRRLIDGAGDTFYWAGVGWRRGHGERDVGQYERAEPIFGACAGAAVYRRAALELVGPLDEDFFAFCEDVDWSFRAQLAGFSCRYVPSAVAYHVGSATLGKGQTDFTRYHIWRNGIWLVLKDYPLPMLLLHGPRLLFRQVENIGVAIRERKLRLLWRVWRDAARGLPGTLRKRRQVQRTRRVSLRALEYMVREAR
jgi:GT2 family glycosyltransferase